VHPVFDFAHSSSDEREIVAGTNPVADRDAVLLDAYSGAVTSVAERWIRRWCASSEPAETAAAA
jgi:hypothetical protein